jgi:hypothetical protein
MGVGDEGVQSALIITYALLEAEAARLARTQATVRVVARLVQCCPELGLAVLEYRRKRLGVRLSKSVLEGIRIGSLIEVTGRLYAVSRSPPTGQRNLSVAFLDLSLPDWLFAESFIGIGSASEASRGATELQKVEEQLDLDAKLLLDACAVRAVDGLDMVLFEQMLHEREAYLREYFACVEAASALADQTVDVALR